MKCHAYSWLFAVVAVALLSSCRTPEHKAGGAAAAGVASDAATLFADYHEERLRLYPMEATYAGDDRYNDQLPNNITEEFRAREKAFFQKYLAAVGHLDPKRISAEDQLSCDILRWECETQLERLRFPMHLMPINQFQSLHLEIGQWAGGTSAQPFKTVRDYENWLKRLDAFTQWCHTAVTNMSLGTKRGYVLPRALTEKTIPQITAMTKLPVEEHLYYAPVKQMPARFPAADRTRLTAAYATMIEKKIVPAFLALEKFLKEEYLPASRSSSGIAAIPRGEEFYCTQIRTLTTTEMTADEIHQLGLREVTRLLGEMNKVRERVGFQGDMKALVFLSEEHLDDGEASHKNKRSKVRRIMLQGDAQALVEEVAATALRKLLWAEPPGLGLDFFVHDVPFQCRTMVW